MSIILNRVCPGLFLDSVVLMQISRSIASLEGVEDSALMIGTPSNLDLLDNAGLLKDTSRQAAGGDLIIAVRGKDDTTALRAMAKAESLLEQPVTTIKETFELQPRSLRSALASFTDANMALVSVPGEFAAAEARKALRAGLHVMLFSDNVSVSEEVELKREAAEVGLLVMGPDCGTSIIGGVMLGFANRIPKGDIGIVGASGTGLQEISCLIAQAGHGISHAIGVGGRDLSDQVGALSTLAVLEMLEADSATRHILLVSKPPSPDVAECVVESLGRSKKTATVCFIGADEPKLPNNVSFTRTLKAAAENVTGILVNDPRNELQYKIPKLTSDRKLVKGLFSGGTLAAEAQVLFLDQGVSVASNAPIAGAMQDDALTGHVILDLGSDEYTKGRPHPMIEPAVREDEIIQSLADPSVAVILLDVVIGYGAHPDPAGEVARVVSEVQKEKPIVVASVTGTNEDPQGRKYQIEKLVDAGILVAPSNADAVKLALHCIGRND